MMVAPVSRFRARAAWCRSSEVVPTRWTVAPSRSTTSRLTGGASVGEALAQARVRRYSPAQQQSLGTDVLGSEHRLGDLDVDDGLLRVVLHVEVDLAEVEAQRAALLAAVARAGDRRQTEAAFRRATGVRCYRSVALAVFLRLARA